MIDLFEYQKNAIKAWINNNYIGIFEMATGTGKTYTALGCLEEIIKTKQNIICVISVPYKHLCSQWARSTNTYDNRWNIFIANSSISNWKNNLNNLLTTLTDNQKFLPIILTTHDTLMSEDFNKIIENKINTHTYMLIADEMHGLGSEQRRKSLTETFKYRLGLSATPSRWYDEEGTDVLYTFFDKEVFNFDLSKALSTENPLTQETFLCPYYYKPSFVSLNEEELELYIALTLKIVFYLNKQTDKKVINKDDLEKLLIKRANIIKNANNKIPELFKILDSLKKLDHAIIYCSPEQIDIVGNILYQLKIKCNRFTMRESTVPSKKYNGLSERDLILKRFADGEYNILIAMKCLDEGVDVPSASTGILLSSCGNPREYIQRIGRLIRRYQGKKNANIYDIIVKPNIYFYPKEIRSYETRIFLKELTSITFP